MSYWTGTMMMHGRGGFDPNTPFGTYVEDQAGYYGGLIEDEGQLYALFVADKTLGGERPTTGVFSGYRDPPVATSLTNGFANSEALVVARGSDSIAAHYCRSLTIGGRTDWYLPAKDELNELHLNLAPGNAEAALFQTGQAQAFGQQYYWSSTEASADNAWAQQTNNGNQLQSYKPGSNLGIRAIRRLAI